MASEKDSGANPLIDESAPLVLPAVGSAEAVPMNYQVRTRGQAFSDESWLGKLIGSEEKKSDRRVEVVVMQR